MPIIEIGISRYVQVANCEPFSNQSFFSTVGKQTIKQIKTYSTFYEYFHLTNALFIYFVPWETILNEIVELSIVFDNCIKKENSVI